MKYAAIFIASITSFVACASFAASTYAKSTVKTTVNGVVKEFTAEDGESINYQSEDGSVKVNINNNDTNTTITSTQKSPTPTTQTPTNTQKKDDAEKIVQGIKDKVEKKIENKKEELEKKFNIFEFFNSFFKNFFHF